MRVWIIGLILLLTGVATCFCRAQTFPGEEIIASYKARYFFDYWPGKNGPVRGIMSIAPLLPEGLQVEKPGSVRVSGSLREGKGLSVIRGFIIGRPDLKGKILLDITVADTCLAAQEGPIYIFAASSSGSIRPSAKNVGLDVGDVGFASPGREGGFHSVLFVRNNVFFDIRASETDIYPFVAPLAQSLDRALLKTPTAAEYRKLPGRPVVKQVKLSGPGEPKILEAVDPQDEKLEYTDLYYDFAGSRIPIVVNESLLVGLPSSTLPWKSPIIVEFLQKYE